MVSWVHTYLQTDRVVYIKYVQLFLCPSKLDKMVPKKKEKSQKYQTKFSHIFLEAFLSKTSKNQPQRNFTNLFKSEIFFMVREKSKGK